MMSTKSVVSAARHTPTIKEPPTMSAMKIDPTTRVLKVLTVDDSEMIQTMYRLVLRRYTGCKTTAACNGQEALEKLREDNFDLILLDVNMPIMTGLEFLASFHQRGAKPPAPVIVVSTEGRNEDVETALQLGATAYLIKPFKSSSLHEIIDSIF